MQFRMFQNILKHFRPFQIFQNILDHFRTFQNVLECFRRIQSFQNLSSDISADKSADTSADVLRIIIQHLYKEEVQHSTFVNSNMVMRYPKNIKQELVLKLLLPLDCAICLRWELDKYSTFTQQMPIYRFFQKLLVTSDTGTI